MATMGTPAGNTEIGATPANGGAMAAFLAAGIGSVAMGLFVILNEAGLFAPPSLHAPSGGISGRTTFAVMVWLIAWALLHWQWRARHVEPGRVYGLTLLFVGLGLLGTYPPVWTLF